MHKRTEKAKKQREDQKNEAAYFGTRPEHPQDRLRRKTKNTVIKTPEGNEVVYLGTQSEHARDWFKRKVKNRLKKEAEYEVVYLGTRPRHRRDRFRGRDNKIIAQIIKKVKKIYKWLIKDENSVFYTANRINRKLINRAKTSLYNKDEIFVKLYKESKNIEEIYFDETNQPNVPLATPFVQKKEILIVQFCIVLRVPSNCYMQILPT